MDEVRTLEQRVAELEKVLDNMIWLRSAVLSQQNRMIENIFNINTYINEQKRKEAWRYEQAVKSLDATLDAMGIPETENEVKVVED